MFESPFDDAREDSAANGGAPQNLLVERAQPPAPPTRARRFGRWRIARWILAGLLLLCLIVVAWLAIVAPPSRTLRPIAPPSVTLLASNGSLISRRGAVSDSPVDVHQLPAHVSEAFLAIEDRRFYHHIGVDPLGLVRAVYTWATGAKRLSATSTITQQLARNVFLNSNRTIDRKLREAVLAMALEAKFSKQQILELYLNKVYFGGGAYGIDSASRKFFSHPADHLSNAEAAIIAGMVKAPSRYSPTADVDAAVDRANVVLGLMHEQGMISAEEASVDPGTVHLKPEEGQNSVRYFTDWALPQLDLLLPDNDSNTPIEVWTTIDLGMQKAATEAV